MLHEYRTYTLEETGGSSDLHIKRPLMHAVRISGERGKKERGRENLLILNMYLFDVWGMGRRKAIQIIYQAFNKMFKALYIEQPSVKVKCEDGFHKCRLDND